MKYDHKENTQQWKPMLVIPDVYMTLAVIA